MFIDARDLGFMADRTHKEFSDEDIQKIVKSYDTWRENKNYQDEAGFCKVATLEEIEENDWALTPGRYVGIKEAEEDAEPFEEKFPRLLKDLKDQLAKEAELNKKIEKQLSKIEG